jgi:hypothetical protein
MIRRSFLRNSSLLSAIAIVSNKSTTHQNPDGTEIIFNHALLQNVPIAGIQFGRFSRKDRFEQLQIRQQMRLTCEPENIHDE